MSSVTFNGTVVSYGTSTTDLVVSSANSPFTVASTGTAHYQNVTVNYGCILKIPSTADFRVNTKLKNDGTIIYSAAGSGTATGTTGDYNGGAGGGGGGYYAGSDGSRGGVGGTSPLETYLSGTITDYTAKIPNASGTGSSGANGNGGTGPTGEGQCGGSTGGGGGGAGGGSVKIIAKVFENNGLVDAKGLNGGNGGNLACNRGSGGGGGGGGGGGSIWVIGEQLTGFGSFTAAAGSGGWGGSVSGGADGVGGGQGGAGGNGYMRFDIGTYTAFRGIFTPSSAASLKINPIPYDPPPASSSSGTPTSVYTFGSDATTSKAIRINMLKSNIDITVQPSTSNITLDTCSFTGTITGTTLTISSVPYFTDTSLYGVNNTCLIRGGETLSGAGVISGTYITAAINGTGTNGATYTVSNNYLTSTGAVTITAGGPYFFKNILITQPYNLIIGKNQIVYCKLLQVNYGAFLANQVTTGGPGNGGNGEIWNNNGSNFGGGGGAGGYGQNGGNGGNPTNGNGLGGTAYNSLALNQANMYQTSYTGTGYGGSNGGSGGFGERHVREWCRDENNREYACRTDEGNPGGGGSGRGFVKIFAWETILNGTWNAKGSDGGNGSWRGGAGGGGSGGGVMLVTGTLTADSTYGNIDIRPGAGGSPGESGGQAGGTGGGGRAYIFAATNNMSLASAANFPGSPTNTMVYMDTNNLVTKTTDSSPPSGAFFIYSTKKPGSSTATVVNQSTFSNIRYGDIVNFRHYLNEYPYSYTDKLYINGVLQNEPLMTYVNKTVTGVSNPWAVTCDPTGRFVFVANYGASNIVSYTIDASTGVLPSVGTPVAASTPQDIACDPTGKFLYATNYNAYTVQSYTIHQTTGALTLVGTTAAGRQPKNIASHPTGKFVYVSNYSSGSVQRYTVNQSTGVLTSGAGATFTIASGASTLTSGGTITTAGAGYSVGDVLKVDLTAYLGGKITVASINASGGIVTFSVVAGSAGSGYAAGSTYGTTSQEWATLIPVGGEPTSIACDPTGKFAYVWNSSARTIHAYTINAITGVLTSVGTPIDISATLTEYPSVNDMVCDPTGRFLYVAATYNVLVYAINASTGALILVQTSAAINAIGTYTALKSIACDPTGKFVYATTIGPSTVMSFAINSYTGELTSLVQTVTTQSPNNSDMACDPTGKFVYVIGSGTPQSVETYSLNNKNFTIGEYFVTNPATEWETAGMVMNWGEITINKFGRYSLTFNATDYWGIGGDNPEGPFEGSVIPIAFPISF